MTQGVDVAIVPTYANTDLGYWIQTVAYFFAAVGACGAAFVAFKQLSALSNQIKAAEAHSSEQIKLIRLQMKSSDRSSGLHIEALKEQIESDGRMARLRATVEVARMELTDKELLDAFKVFSEQRDLGAEHLIGLARKHPSPTEENSALLRVLNNYEYIAVAIKEGAFDKALYSRLKRGSVVKDWDSLKPYVRVLRLKYRRPKIGIEWEILAEEWRE